MKLIIRISLDVGWNFLKAAFDGYAAKYPELNAVSSVMEDVSKTHSLSCCDKNYDGKWRPYTMLLGVLYTVQQTQDWGGRNVPRYNQDQLVEVFGYFWNLIRIFNTKIRPGLDEHNPEVTRKLLKSNRIDYARHFKIHEDDVVHVWTGKLSPKGDSGSFTPDHSVILLRRQKFIILTIPGTEAFPKPKPRDILMDLVADSAPFLDGLAHKGISQGAKNILKKAGPVLKHLTYQHPDYQVLFVGYSLGAGLAQLITLDCTVGECRRYFLPRTTVRTIAFGPPPVFTTKPVSKMPSLKNIVLVQNRDDGIVGSSLNNVYDTINEICAIRSMQLGRPEMLDLILKGTPDIDNTGFLRNLISSPVGTQNLLPRIKSKVLNVKSFNDEPDLLHLSPSLFRLDKMENGKARIVREFIGKKEVHDVGKHIRLSPTMLDDHVSYDLLFDEKFHGNTDLNFNIDILDNI